MKRLHFELFKMFIAKVKGTRIYQNYFLGIDRFTCLKVYFGRTLTALYNSAVI